MLQCLGLSLPLAPDPKLPASTFPGGQQVMVQVKPPTCSFRLRLASVGPWSQPLWAFGV